MLSNLLISSPLARRALSLFVSCLIMIVSGGNNINSKLAFVYLLGLYMFAVYSTQMSVIVDHYSGEKISIDIAGSAGDFGLYLGIVSGLMYDYFGPTIVLIYGMIMINFGFSMIYLTLHNVLPAKLWLLCLYYFCVGQGSYAFVCASSTSAVKSFSKDNLGKITGLMFALYGASPVVLTLIYTKLFHKDIYLFFFFCIVLFASLGLIGLATITETPVAEIFTLIDDESSTEESKSILTNPIINNDTDVSEIDDDKKGEEITMKEISGINLFKELNFYLIFFSMVFITGDGLMWKNIMGSFGNSFNMDSGTLANLVIAWALCGTFSRFLMGSISDIFAGKVVRSVWILPFLYISFASSVTYLCTNISVGIIWFINVANALGYGGYFTMQGTLVAIFFGRKNLGTNMSVFIIAAAIGGLSFTAASTALTKLVTPSGSVCLGSKCYDYTFYLGSCCLFVGCILMTFFTIRNRKYLF